MTVERAVTWPQSNRPTARPRLQPGCRRLRPLDRPEPLPPFPPSLPPGGAYTKPTVWACLFRLGTAPQFWLRGPKWCLFISPRFGATISAAGTTMVYRAEEEYTPSQQHANNHLPPPKKGPTPTTHNHAHHIRAQEVLAHRSLSPAGQLQLSHPSRPQVK